jgi:NADH-quinone oxidoreductase subunit A
MAAFVAMALFFLVVAGIVSSMLRKQEPNAEKLSPYECGEEAVGSPWVKFNLRFYLVGLLFVLFEAELVLLFPWAVFTGAKNLPIENVQSLKYLAFTEALVFVSILFLGLLYAWKHGFLDSAKPQPQEPFQPKGIDSTVYENLKW